MLDLAAGIEARNYGLRRATDVRNLLELLKIVLPLMAIAAVLSIHIWVDSQSIHIGYQSQQLKAQEERLLQIQQQLVLEEQILKDPELLEAIARNDLGMILLPANKVILAPSENWDQSSSVTPALEHISRPSEPKKPSAFN